MEMLIKNAVVVSPADKLNEKNRYSHKGRCDCQNRQRHYIRRRDY